MLPPHPQTRHYYSSTSAVTAAITADPAEFGAPVLTADACGRGLPWPHAHTHTGRRVASATPGGLSAGSLWALAAHSTPSSAPRPCSCHAGQTRACDAAVWTGVASAMRRLKRMSPSVSHGRPFRGPDSGGGELGKASESRRELMMRMRCAADRQGPARRSRRRNLPARQDGAIEIFVAPVPPQIPIFMVSLYKVL